MQTQNLRTRTCRIILVAALVAIETVLARHAVGQASDSIATSAVGLPEGAKAIEQFAKDGLSVYGYENTLWLLLDSDSIQRRKAMLPRMCASIRSFRWKNETDVKLKFVPEPEEWVFSWEEILGDRRAIIEVVFDSRPVLPSDCPAAAPAGDGSVMLHAYQAATFGEKLRFEPQWYKNTVGYWVIPTDYASWNLSINQPGSYSVAVLQGCGKGQGGSDGVLTLHQNNQKKAELPFRTVDTGHFQNFRWNHLGLIEVSDAGEYKLRIAPVRIAKAALFDARAIHLVRQAKRVD